MSKSIDINMINEIRDLQSDSDPDVLSQLLTIFLDSIQERLTKIESAILSGSANDLRADAHSIKSSSAHIRATEMSALCAKLENQGKTSDLRGARELLDKLKVEIVKVTKELQELPEMKLAGGSRKAA